MNIWETSAFIYPSIKSAKNPRIERGILSERHLVYTVRFLIGHDILALVLFLSRRDRRKEQRMQRREEEGGGGEGKGGRRKALRTRDNGRATRGPAAVVSAGGIGRGAEASSSRIPLVPPRRPAKSRLRQLKIRLRQSPLCSGAAVTGRFRRRYIFLGKYAVRSNSAPYAVTESPPSAFHLVAGPPPFSDSRPSRRDIDSPSLDIPRRNTSVSSL